MSVVITGSPGVGKHSISKKIAESLQCPIVDVNEIAASSGLAGSDGAVDTDILGGIMECKSGVSVTVGHLAPYVLNPDHVKIVIILRRSPYELVDVYHSRGYDEEKIRDNAGSEILGTIAAYSYDKFGGKACEIDTTESSVDETAFVAMSAISGDVPQAKIDWLEQVARKGDLQRFFAY